MAGTVAVRPRWGVTTWLLLGLVPLFLAGSFFVIWETSQLRERAHRQAIETSMHVARLLEATAGTERMRLRALALSEPFARATVARDREILRQALRFVEIDPNWQGVTLFAGSGETVVTVGAALPPDLVDDGGEFFLPAGSQSASRMVVPFPVLLDGAVVGRIVGVYQLGALEQALGAAAAGKGSLLVLDRTGLVLAGVGSMVGRRVSRGDQANGDVELPEDLDHSPIAVESALDGALRVVSFRPPVRMFSIVLPVAIIFVAVGLFLSALVINARTRLVSSEVASMRRERELRAVYELALEATQQAQRDRFLRMACSRAAALVQGVSASLVALTTLDRNHVLLYRGFPDPHPKPTRLDSASNPLLARALNHGRRESGTQELRSPNWSEALGSHEWECWTPLVAHGQVLGALGLLGEKGNGGLTTEEAVLLDSFAATLAVALESQDRLSRLTHQGKMLSTVVESSPDGIAALSAGNRICLENPAFRRLLGLERSVTGRSLAEAIAEFKRRGGRLEIDFDPNTLIRQAREGSTTRGSFRIVLEGESRLVESVMAPLTLPSGEGGTLLSLRDVSEREELHEVRRLHRQVAALAESAANRAALLDKVLAASALGIAYFDRDGRVQYVNALFEELVGRPAPQRGSDVGAVETILNETFGITFDQLTAGAEVLTPHRAERVLAVRCVDVFGEEGVALGKLLSLRDVTEKQALEAAREAFIGVAAHELKNPVAALRLQTEVALRSEGTRQRKSLERVHVRVAELQALVERLLDITRADLGKLELERAPVSLARIAREAVEQQTMLGKQVVVRPSCHDDHTCVAFADPLRARQALDNLLSNAIRYGAGKPVEVNVGSDDAEVFVEVKDRGPGIPESERERIFGRFGQGRVALKGPGLGIGLYLAKRIVEAHGGRLELESTVGKGSTFRLVFPSANEAMRSASPSLLPPSMEPPPPTA